MVDIDPNIKVETGRLLFQPVSEKYKFEICKEFTPEVTRFMPFSPTGDIKMTEAFIANSQQQLLNGSNLHFCMVNKNTNEFIGCCGLHNVDTAAIEIGLWIKENAWSKGFGTETVKALIYFAGEQFKYNYLIYPVDAKNLASRNIPEKLGFSIFGSYVKKKNEMQLLDVIEYRKNRILPG
jgi:[ribosomal protein S5]-alanine N-acetyltransferase